ncbi:MAG: lipopolysaccharide biosynthesis protein [Hungatella sp.]|nr:lipopolysaccharide biosynthesis protein [Hungatella sp.]
MREKIASGLLWTYAERFLAQAISLIVTVILARLIKPEEYGVISIALIFIALADTFAINGMGNALIQKRNADYIDFSSVFYFNLIFSVGLYVIIFFCADPLAAFYEIEKVAVVMKVLAIKIPIAAINSVQQAYVSKRMEFRKFFFATIGGTAVSAVIGITMAYYKFGVWALVAQYLTNSVIDTIVLWFTVRWRPQKVWSWERVKGLLSYGWKILATSLLISIYGNIQDLIIGKKFSPSDLAYSNKGRQFPSLIASNINTSISKVLFPAVSEVQCNILRVKSMTRSAIKVGNYILSPLLMGFMAITDTFIEIILTDKWLPAAPYMRIMCLVFLLQPMQTASIQAMKALGKSGVYLKLEIAKKIGGTFILLYSVFGCNSVIAIIIGSLLAELLSTIMNFPVNKKMINYSYREQVYDFVPVFAVSGVMSVLVYLTGKIISNLILKLLCQITFGGIIYLLFSIWSKNAEFMYIKDIFKNIVKKRGVRE